MRFFTPGFNSVVVTLDLGCLQVCSALIRLDPFRVQLIPRTLGPAAASDMYSAWFFGKAIAPAKDPDVTNGATSWGFWKCWRMNWLIYVQYNATQRVGKCCCGIRYRFSMIITNSCQNHQKSISIGKETVAWALISWQQWETITHHIWTGFSVANALCKLISGIQKMVFRGNFWIFSQESKSANEKWAHLYSFIHLFFTFWCCSQTNSKSQFQIWLHHDHVYVIIIVGTLNLFIKPSVSATAFLLQMQFAFDFHVLLQKLETSLTASELMLYYVKSNNKKDIY